MTINTKKYTLYLMKVKTCYIKLFSILKNTIKDVFNLKKKTIKNTLLFLLISFSIFFSFFAITTAREINKLSNIKFKNSYRQTNVVLRNKIKKMTTGYPIGEMAYYISREDNEVVAFMMAIAKKESNWGKRTPKLNGKECYNYWGFRRKRSRMGSGGHTCFDNPKDAVKTVSKRIENLLAKGINTPQKMVIWKCGYNCNAQNPQSVTKWIQDVNFYYSKF